LVSGCKDTKKIVWVANWVANFIAKNANIYRKEKNAPSQNPLF
jgi:hypothetical protein